MEAIPRGKKVERGSGKLFITFVLISFGIYIFTNWILGEIYFAPKLNPLDDITGYGVNISQTVNIFCFFWKSGHVNYLRVHVELCEQTMNTL